jgi:DNA-binding MarR family transcriptional regulator
MIGFLLSKNMSNQISYTTINHLVRKKLGLSMHEYALADLIYNLANNPKSDYPGWCYSSKETLGEILDLSKQSILTLIKKLIKKGIVIKHNGTKHLRITFDWYSAVVISNGKESLPTVKKVYRKRSRKFTAGGKESLPNKYIYKDNNKYIPNSLVKVKPLHCGKVNEIYDFYIKQTGSKEKLSELRRHKIKKRIDEFGVEECKKAILGAINDPFLMGENDRGNKYANLDFIFRSFEKTEQLINKYDKLEIIENKDEPKDIRGRIALGLE